LKGLGYNIIYKEHAESGRAYLSKGLVKEAQQLAIKNVQIFKDLISEDTPLIGIEPSGILSFRDEYPKLVDEKDSEQAHKLGKNCLMLEEFLYREAQIGNISAEQFDDNPQHYLIHGHCHQKALSSVDNTAFVLSLPRNSTVEIIPSGCCGMAGSFGYEKEHYSLSMQVGELVLFPKIRQSAENINVAAPGTSCRHQIKDGTNRHASHPAELLLAHLKK
jgi:Fe-S oxidoreductase